MTSLYNACIYAQKYDLELRYAPFRHAELFACFDSLQPVGDASHAFVVISERDVASRKRFKFNINVLSEQIGLKYLKLNH